MESINMPAVAYSEDAVPRTDDSVECAGGCGYPEEDCECPAFGEDDMEALLVEAANEGALDGILETQPGGLQIHSVHTYEEAGLLTRNKGVVLTLERNGEKFKFHIQIVQDRRN